MIKVDSFQMTVTFLKIQCNRSDKNARSVNFGNQFLVKKVFFVRNEHGHHQYRVNISPLGRVVAIEGDPRKEVGRVLLAIRYH